jgi:hypothetical protein
MCVPYLDRKRNLYYSDVKLRNNLSSGETLKGGLVVVWSQAHSAQHID